MSLLLLTSSLLLIAGETEAAVPADAPSVDVLDVAGMQKMIMRHDKVVLLMHSTGCTRAAEFAPTFAKIARQVPRLAFGQIDVNGDKQVAVAAARGVVTGAPALKAFFRNAPPSRRVLEYRGQPTFAAVLEWARAIDTWDGGEGAPQGWEAGRVGDSPSSKPLGKEEL